MQDGRGNFPRTKKGRPRPPRGGLRDVVVVDGVGGGAGVPIGALLDGLPLFFGSGVVDVG